MGTHEQPTQAVTAQHLAAAVDEARLKREESEALRAESRRARRRAEGLRAASNAILESAAAITAEVLARRRFALAEPVLARFQTDEAGNTGIELTMRLEDAALAAAAREAIVERFGGQSACDSLIVS